jgi:SAM-dependent methyltransferase
VRASWDDGTVTAYAEYARFYDQANGDRTADIERIRSLIRRYRPAAASLLELGCGTGAVLAGLAADMSVAGIDRSPEMLAIAERTVPAARLMRADITAFDLRDRFDVAICVFDTINHLSALADWLSLFDRAREHLTAGGLFLFDLNTAGRLRRLGQGPAFAADIGQHTLVMDVRPAARESHEGDRRGGELSVWTVRVFERLEGDLFRLHREDIAELGVPLAVVRQALADHGFDVLEMTGPDGEPGTDESSRVFIAAAAR